MCKSSPVLLATLLAGHLIMDPNRWILQDSSAIANVALDGVINYIQKKQNILGVFL